MRAFAEIVRLELRALVRSKTLALLIVAGAAWTLGFPRLVTGDGTAEGLRELTLRFSLGGVFALVALALLASATGSLARERAARRLQLTQVRPVRFFALALGKIAAHVLVGAFVLALACGALALTEDLARPCRHVLSPAMPSPREEAEAMYDWYMKSPETPSAVKAAKREVVIRLLETKAVDRYQSVRTNETARWTFPGFGGGDAATVRLRFTNAYEMRQEIRGDFSVGALGGSVSNFTQAVVEVPLSPVAQAAGATNELVFVNRGAGAVMLRPRRDIHLLVAADSFGANLVRTYVVLVALLALVVAFGVFLSAGLSRPVALFTAFVVLAVSEMSPSVLTEYPDQLETDRLDRWGLAVARVAAQATEPVSSASPLEALAKDECVEPAAVVRLILADLVLTPLVFSFLAGILLPRKQDPTCS